MRKENVKSACIEVVDGLKCVLEAQFSQRSKQSCVPLLKTPVNRFCKIAKHTEKRFKKEDPLYEISRFLGASAPARKKMGIVCSTKQKFPKCDRAIALTETRKYTMKWTDYFKALKPCAKEVNEAIRTKPIERSQDYSKLLTSFETMRDWMHVSGYALPDYVWVTPKNMRTKVKRLFEYLSSPEVTSIKDLDHKKAEIEMW